MPIKSFFNRHGNQDEKHQVNRKNRKVRRSAVPKKKIKKIKQMTTRTEVGSKLVWQIQNALYSIHSINAS